MVIIITNIIIVGNYAKAEKLLNKLLNRFRKKFGEDSDPSILYIMNSLAIAKCNQGKYSDAEVLYKQCLDKRKVVLGENHPSTLNTIHSLAIVASKLQAQTESSLE